MPRRLSVLLHPLVVGNEPFLWRDWSRREHRHACLRLVRHQQIEASLPPALVALPLGARMEAWVKDFDSWDICDQVCGNLFDKTPYAFQKAVEWCHRDPEFVRRAGFVLMADLA